jgi:alkylation response protein AidB-like acyl-CoA dehydrogenase
MAVAFRAWLADQAGRLPVAPAGSALTVEEGVAQGRALLAVLYEAGWNRYGWPVEAGGLGGDARHRAVFYDELARAGIDAPEQNIILEVVAPALLEYTPERAAGWLPRILRGSDVWCQGFSEPEAGSDLAALRCHAVPTPDGPGYVVNGQKIWTTFGHVADRMALLCRTGSAGSRHRGLTMFFVDMDSPGIEARPIRYASGRNEIAEVFFHDVHVPADRAVGPVDGGWGVAMFLLQYERGMYAWMRQAVLSHLLRRLADDLTAAGVGGELAELRIGQAALAVAALRARAAATVEQLGDGVPVGPAASADKLLLAAAEQTLLDTARDLLQPVFDLHGDAPGAQRWRDDWFYTRAASLYGGTSEIQKSIVADRVLRLPKE